MSFKSCSEIAKMSITAKDVCYARKKPFFESHSSNCIANNPSSANYSISGDWEFIARLLGLTGPSGTFFCNFCHVQLKDLEQGKPHTPWLLQEGATASHTCTKTFPVRSFESILSDNDRYVKGGSVKSKANQFHNCESTPIYQATGPVIDPVSCMPLHLSLGLGKQALELVESETISLDNTIKEANGEASPEMVEAFQKRDELILECDTLEELLEDNNEASEVSYRDSSLSSKGRAKVQCAELNNKCHLKNKMIENKSFKKHIINIFLLFKWFAVPLILKLTKINNFKKVCLKSI